MEGGFVGVGARCRYCEATFERVGTREDDNYPETSISFSIPLVLNAGVWVSAYVGIILSIEHYGDIMVTFAVDTVRSFDRYYFLAHESRLAQL